MGRRLVLGFGNNVDYELVWDAGVLETLIVEYGIDARELGRSVVINGERGLVVSILSHMQAEIGGERFIQDPQVVEEFAARFHLRITMGGTPIRAAIAIHPLGYETTLHLVTMNDHVRRLLPPNTTFVQATAQDQSFPHLIVQYPRGAHIRARDIHLQTSRANRIIYHHDTLNIHMPINLGLATYCHDAKVFLISGFNAMQDEALLVDRITAVKQIVTSLPPTAIVYYEDGGFYAESLKTVLNELLGEYIDIHGMNEDEFMEYLGRDVDLLDGGAVARGLAEVSQLIAARTVLVHTGHWVAAYGENAAELRPAIEQGVQLATTRFRAGDGFSLADYNHTAMLRRQASGLEMERRLSSHLGSRVCCVAAYDVPGAGVTTVGLGDAFVGGLLSRLSASDVVYLPR